MICESELKIVADFNNNTHENVYFANSGADHPENVHVNTVHTEFWKSFWMLEQHFFCMVATY